ncbi:hypothetical protein NQ318_005957 [Aromia moschata]|uniref:C2H2-type domain-containing protein n=1 Tax=Aromia moschata TaxID=1265417 RepID=A0AAV8XEZ0_9CUCU|nr:hypothetical protein NQ318_005957 [Aromia moschata]
MKSYVDEPYNPETNYVFIKSNSAQNACEIEMDCPKGLKLIEGVADTRYYCKFYPSVTKRERDLSKHVPIHQTSLETRIYDCSFCSYNTKRKSDLTKHMLIHKDASEITTYQCALCPYIAKQKSYIIKHMLIHKDASEVTTYNCNFCSYKTKFKKMFTQAHVDS